VMRFSGLFAATLLGFKTLPTSPILPSAPLQFSYAPQQKACVYHVFPRPTQPYYCSVATERGG